MKHLLYAIPLAALIACGGEGGLFGQAEEMDNVKLTKATPLTDGDDSPHCEMTLQVLAARGNSDKARNINNAIEQRLFAFSGLSMKQAVDSFANFYTSEYRKNMARLYREDRGDEQRKPWYEYTYAISTETATGRDDCLIYTATVDVFEGGAHGYQQQIVMNFDAHTGEKIGLADVLVSGYEVPLSELLLQELKKQTGAKSLDELHDMGYLLTMDIYPPQNFRLESDGIAFIYNIYEIAPYVKGATELKLSNAQLEKLLKR